MRAACEVRHGGPAVRTNVAIYGLWRDAPNIAVEAVPLYSM